MLRMKKRVIMICLMAFGWGTYAQHGHNGHHPQQQTHETQAFFAEEEVNPIYSAYLNLQKALVNSSQEKAQQAASNLQRSVEEIENGKGLEAEAAKVAAAISLKAQREAFTSLSKKMTEFVKSKELSEGKIYLGYCPMANENIGGSWLTASTEIRNPYFGDKMLKCGTIKETIE